MSDAATIKETRTRLRLVEEHLAMANLNLGATRQRVGLVEVIHHPDNALPYLNYVSPRKNTAWLPRAEIEKGMERLRELGRQPRFTYIEGLFPPLFAKSVREVGMVMEQEIPFMIYSTKDHPYKGLSITMPSGARVEEVATQDGSALWWYVWRNAHYDVLTQAVEPLYIGKTMREITLGNQVDILLYEHAFPIGAIRLTFHEQTAHIAALALVKDSRTPRMVNLLYQIGLRAALQRDYMLIFTSGEREEDRRLCRELGFVDSGSAVRYVEASGEPPREEADEKPVAQPVFVLR